MATKDQKLRARALAASAAPKKKTRKKASRKKASKAPARKKKGRGTVDLGELTRAAGVVEQARRIIAKADGKKATRR
jgi:hypothetical protein